MRGELAFEVLAEQFHVAAAVLVDPFLGDLDGEGAHQPQATRLGGEDAHQQGAACDLQVEPFEHVGRFEVLVMLAGRPAGGEGLVNVGFDSGAQFLVLVRPAGEPPGEIATGFFGGVPVVEPAPLGEAVVGRLRGR